MKKDKGFVTTVLLIIVGLALLKYFFNWSIFDAAASEEGRSTISYIRDVLNTVWSWIEAPVKFIWNEVLKPFLDYFKDALGEMIQEGRNSS